MWVNQSAAVHALAARWWMAFIVYSCLVLSSIEVVSAASPVCAEPNLAAGPVRLLIVTGWHPYEPNEFFRAFDGLKNITYEHVFMVDAKPAAFPNGGLKRYDVVLFYDMEPNAITPEWRSLLDRAHGFVFLHHAIGSFPQTFEYRDIVGGHANFFPEPSKGVPSTTFHPNAKQQFTIVDREHPITCGLRDFEMTDEAYDNVDVDSAAHALLKSSYPQKSPVVAWTWAYKGKRVFYLQPGHGSLGLAEDHGPTAYQDSSFLRLLDRGVLWAADRL